MSSIRRVIGIDFGSSQSSIAIMEIGSTAKPELLRDGKIYTLLNNIVKIYDNQYFQKLYEIKFENQCKIKSLIQLDNKDLAFILEKNEGFNLLIFRLKDKNYSLFQKH